MVRKISLFSVLLIAVGSLFFAQKAFPAKAMFSSTDLLVYPYLGSTSADSVTISWATDAYGAGEVHFSTDQSFGNSVIANSLLFDGRYWYSARISGLAAKTTYSYRIFNDGTDLTPWPSVTFSTAPEADNTSLNFEVVGDNQPADAGAAPYQMALNVASAMSRLTPDMVLHTGDMIYDGSICSGTTSGWSQFVRNYFNVYQSMLGTIPFFTTIGNHEVQNGGCGYQAYTEVYSLPENAPAGSTEQYYSFDWGNAHFVVLDGNQYFGSGSTEYNWLANDLQTSTKPWKFVSIHIPAYSSGNSGSDSHVDKYLVPLFETYGVNVVFNGHDHDYERTCPILNGACTTVQAGGVVYITTGGGGAYTAAVGSSWFTEYSRSINEFLSVNLNDCQLTVNAIDQYGNGFDSYTMDRCTGNTPTSTLTSTPTSAGEAGAFRFVSWSDSQDEDANLSTTSIQAGGLNPAFTIFNGDLEDNGVDISRMDVMRAALGNLEGRTFLIRGNHDDKVANSAALWENYFSGLNSPLPAGVTNYTALDPGSAYLNYSFDFSNSRFIGLDVPGDADLLNSTELAFLENRLADAEAAGLTHAFIFFHGPEYCIESIHCNCSSRDDGSCTPASLISVINRHPIVSATFHGHEHVLGWVHMDSSRVSGLTGSYEEFITSPAGGWSYNDYVYPDRLDYYYPDMASAQGFATIDVDGPAFTFSIYKTGIAAPVWSRTFTKAGVIPTATPTNTGTAAITQPPTQASTPTPTSTRTSTPTFTPTASLTATSLPGGFPSTGVIDNFDRVDGSIGTNWAINRTGFKITNNRLGVSTGGIIFWKPVSYGPNQEAYVTFVNIDTAASDMDLYLKSQSSSSLTGMIEVWYNPTAHNVKISTYTSSQGYNQCGSTVAVTFSNGDQLGARATADGKVQVYRNGSLIGNCDASAWPYASSGGYLGLSAIGAANALFDDFGGGTINSSPTYTLTSTATATPSFTFTSTSTNPPTATHTLTPSSTSLPTNTNTFTPTITYTSTATELAPETASPTETYTNTPVQTATPTFTFIPTATDSPQPMNTFTPTPSNTPTLTPTPTYTFTPKPTPTYTFTPTQTASPTATMTLTPTSTVTATYTYTTTATNPPTSTYTPSPTRTPTATRTPTKTITPTRTRTPTRSRTPTATRTRRR